MYYFGENFQARSDDLAKKLEKVTGKSAQECADEIKLCADVIFQFAAGCDKKTGKLNVRKSNNHMVKSKKYKIYFLLLGSERIRLHA